MSDHSVTLTVTRSAGDDRAVLVLIDTTFEPDGADDGPGIRILLNDNEVYVGKEYDFLGRKVPGHRAAARQATVDLDDIPYLTDETK